MQQSESERLMASLPAQVHKTKKTFRTDLSVNTT